MSELGRVREKASWRDSLLRVLTAWNRNQVWKILTAIVVIWIVSGFALHFAERGTNPAFATLRESFWNVWVTLFSGLNTTPQSVAGRLVMSGVLVVGVALAGLFTASVASILIERSLRSREVSNLEMSDLVPKVGHILHPLDFSCPNVLLAGSPLRPPVLTRRCWRLVSD